MMQSNLTGRDLMKTIRSSMLPVNTLLEAAILPAPILALRVARSRGNQSQAGAILRVGRQRIVFRSRMNRGENASESYTTVMTIERVAELFGVSPETIRRMAVRKQIGGAFKFGGS
jgi:DeoR-like protein with HTH domain